MYVSESCAILEGLEHRLSKDPDNASTKDNIKALRKNIRGNHYRGDSEYYLTGHDGKEDREYFDKNTAYRISSHKYFYYYVGHYSPKKYKKEMEDFKNGKRKSRPNGRIWHKIPVKKDRRKGWWNL
jgi:hypothetical protein